MKHVSIKIEALELTADGLLKLMSKEQAIAHVQGILRLMGESLNDPDVRAANVRLEKLLEELNHTEGR